MSDARITFDQPVETASTPAVSRRRRGWVSPESWRSVVAGSIALGAHVLVLWVAGLLPHGDGGGGPLLRPEVTPDTVMIPLEVFEESAPAGVTPAAAPPRPRAVAPQAAPVAAPVEAAAPSPSVVAPALARAGGLVDLSHFGGVRGLVSAALPGAAGTGTPQGARSHDRGNGVGVAGVPGGGGQGEASPSLAQPARTSGGPWQCTWPSEAVEAGLFEQYVTVRVVVSADGSVESAAAQGNPGPGFAAAVEACARRQVYTPGLDERGQPVRATTPAIRVRFWR